MDAVDNGEVGFEGLVEADFKGEIPREEVDNLVFVVVAVMTVFDEKYKSVLLKEGVDCDIVVVLGVVVMSTNSTKFADMVNCPTEPYAE